MKMHQDTHLRQRNFLYLISSIAALAGLLFGYDTGVISGAILFIRKDFQITDSITEMIVSAVLFGALLGSLLGGRLVDVYGRKKVLVAAAICFCIGSLFSAFSQGPIGLILSRAILGVSIGISSFAAPLYLAEISPPEVRGKIVSLNQLAITIGILGSYVIDYILAESEAWRWMLGIGVFPAIALLLGLKFLPESPRWTLMKGQDVQARNTLKTLRNPDQVEIEIKEIRASLSQKELHWSSLFANGILPISLIAVGLSFFQQTTGINTIIYYAPSFLQAAGLGEAKGAILATLGLGVVNVLATIAALPLIDRWGRRPLLLFGIIGMAFSLMISGLAFQWKGVDWINRLSIVSIVIYIISFAMSLGPICWLIISEIFPLEIRGAGAAFATSANWFFNMIVAMTFLNLVNYAGPGGAFWVYGGVCLLAWVFVYFKVPETKGKTLEEIQTQLGVRSKAVQWANRPVLSSSKLSSTESGIN